MCQAYTQTHRYTHTHTKVHTNHIGAQVVADLPEDEVDVILSGDGVGRHTGGGVCGAGDGHLLPGQEEDDTAVAGGRVQQAHVVWADESKGEEVGKGSAAAPSDCSSHLKYPGMTMCTPALGWQMLAVSWLSIFLSESVKGPVALMTHLARTSNSLPEIERKEL